MKTRIVLLAVFHFATLRAYGSIEPTVTLGHRVEGLVLEIQLQNNSDEEVYVFPPWRGGETLMLCPLVAGELESYESEYWTDASSWKVLSTDNSPVKLAPKQSIRGTMDLNQRFTKLAERNRDHEVILFWTLVLYFDAQRHFSDPPKKSDPHAGFFRIPSQEKMNSRKERPSGAVNGVKVGLP